MSQLYKLEQYPIIKLNNPSNWTIQGTSKAGERTGFLLNPLKIILDGGVVSSVKPLAVFLTHSHCDHTLALPTLFGKRMNQIKGQEELYGRPLYLTKDAELPVQKLMEATIFLSDNNSSYSNNYDLKEKIWKRQGYHPIIANVNDKFKIPGIDNILVEVLKAYHSSECVGYGFSSVKNKIKNDYINFSKQEKLDFKNKGGILTEEKITHEFVFFCDSSIYNLEKHDEWKKYPIIICECTGFPEIKIFYKDSHTYLDDIELIIRLNKEKKWFLIHSSKAISKETLMKHQDRLNKDGLDVTFID